jgi:hypothetical protein
MSSKQIQGIHNITLQCCQLSAELSGQQKILQAESLCIAKVCGFFNLREITEIERRKTNFLYRRSAFSVQN